MVAIASVKFQYKQLFLRNKIKVITLNKKKELMEERLDLLFIHIHNKLLVFHSSDYR